MEEKEKTQDLKITDRLAKLEEEASLLRPNKEDPVVKIGDTLYLKAESEKPGSNVFVPIGRFVVTMAWNDEEGIGFASLVELQSGKSITDPIIFGDKENFKTAVRYGIEFTNFLGRRKNRKKIIVESIY